MQTKGIQTRRKTMIVTGASQGIGAGVTKAFIEHGYNAYLMSKGEQSVNLDAFRRLPCSLPLRANVADGALLGVK